MASGQQLAQKNVDAFQSWAASMSDDDFRQITFRGQLNRGEVAKLVGCAKSALRQNPRLSSMLAELENSLRDRGVLPELSEQAKDTAGKPQLHDQNARKQAQDANRVAKLEQENMELKAKNRALEEQLKRFVELSEVLGQYGVLPR